MARVAVPSARASVFDTPAGLVINIPSEKNLRLTSFLGLWLCLWLNGEFSAIRSLATGKTAAGIDETRVGINLFVVVWLVAWTVGGCVAMYIWLWNVAGHEIVSLTPTSLTIRRDILGLGRSSEYDLPSVRNLRIDPWPEDTNLTWRTQSLAGGTIAFDYSAKTFRFGLSLDEAEASNLIDVLKSRYPFDATASQ